MEVKVEQIDREAAAAVLHQHYMGAWKTEDILQGLCDDGEHVQAFARHRIAAIEECAKVAANYEVAGVGIESVDEHFAAQMDDVAEEIRKLAL